MVNTSGEKKSVDDGIANTHDQEQILRGVQPRHQIAYKIYKFCMFFSIIAAVVVVLGFVITLIPAAVDMFGRFTSSKYYRLGLIYGTGAIGVVLGFGFLVKLLLLRKAPFDDWVFEIAEKRLGTSIIFYDSKNIYINYDRSGKEADKRDFVTEMSDKSTKYTYFYVKTFIDQGVIKVECKKRQPIPDRASFKPEDDKFWNIVPMGLTINDKTLGVSPVGWYLNDININEELRETIPSTSILICGGTGCYSEHTPILMYNTLIK